MIKIFHSTPKLSVNDSDIDNACRSMHQSIMKKKQKLLVKIGLLK